MSIWFETYLIKKCFANYQVSYIKKNRVLLVVVKHIRNFKRESAINTKFLVFEPFVYSDEIFRKTILRTLIQPALQSKTSTFLY